MSSQSPGDSSQWLRAHPSPPGPNMFAAQEATSTSSPDAHMQTGGNAPGIPLFLAQARNKATKVAQLPLLYDADHDMMAMGNLDAVLPATQTVLSGDDVCPPAAAARNLDLPMVQHPIPQPSPGFLMAQQSMLAGHHVYTNHDTGQQHAPSAYSHAAPGNGD
ncbi:hypothetical protein E4U41_006657 [Claviceps citrina]|nr:hypothetical protein E4U41_006657 [Claviceps citrina]